MRRRKNHDVLGNDKLEHVWLGEVEFAEGRGGEKRLSIVLDDHVEWRNHGAILANQVLHVKLNGDNHVVQTTHDKL